MPDLDHGSVSAASPYRSLTGWLPLVLAGAALALLGGYLITGPHPPTMVLDHGVWREDEGVAARLWQLLMLAQLAAIALFLVRWVGRAPRQATFMLALQAAGVIVSALPVWLLEH